MKRVLLSILILLTLFLIQKQENIRRPDKEYTEGCLFCHRGVSDPDKFHPINAMGCYRCHLGNPHSYQKTRAHSFMVLNPGDLRVVHRTCGVANCHPDIVHRVKRSVMSTNQGIIGKLQETWLGVADYSTGVEELIHEQDSRNIAIDQFRKMCGGCHLWKRRSDLKTERGRRGGGCSDCHIVDDKRRPMDENTPFRHPVMTIRIPSQNCIKCHNRSARIGISYEGKYDSEGYGTPYQGAGFSKRVLSGGRFYLELPQDVHHEMADMDCIDCHTGTGLMGDGKRYPVMAKQKDIECSDCHAPKAYRIRSDEDKGAKLSFYNEKVRLFKDGIIAISRKGTPLYNVQRINDKWMFIRKRDGALYEIKPASTRPYHTMKGHRRLSCQACHSQWFPQCYGCHITHREGVKKRDWLTGKMTDGSWKETRSYMRFSKPILGLKSKDKIGLFLSSQVFVSCFDRDQRFRPDKSFMVLSSTSFDPHTTSKGSRSCFDCHGDPKAIGLGDGIIISEDETLRIRPTYDSKASGMEINFPPDAIVDLKGRVLQKATTQEERPFNRDEIRRILRVNLCIGCHEKYSDPIYLDFEKSMMRFLKEKDIPCKKSNRANKR